MSYATENFSTLSWYQLSCNIFLRPEFKEKELNISSVDIMRSLKFLQIFKLEMKRSLKHPTDLNSNKVNTNL